MGQTAIDNIPAVVAAIGAFVIFAAGFKKFTKGTPWKWDDPIGSFIGKFGIAAGRLLALGRSLLSAAGKGKK